MYTLSNPPKEHQIAQSIRQILLPRGIRCPRCDRRYDYTIGSRYFCKNCRYKFSWKRLTFLAHTKLPLTQIWQLLYAWLHAMSPHDVAWSIGLSHTTIRRWYRRFSVLIPATDSRILSGIVEVDEVFIGKQHSNNQTIVIGAFARAKKQVVLQTIPNRSQEVTDRFLVSTVAAGSTVCTDSLSSYEHIERFFGYVHPVQNHAQYEFGYTNNIEGLWSRLRQFMHAMYYHVWKEHLPRIIHEFQARHNHQEAFASPEAFLQFITVPSQVG